MINNLVQSSTIHGVTHIHSASSKIFKLFWILLFICGIGGIVVNTVLILIKYFSYPILVSHVLNYEPFKWPDLTFCNPTAPFYFELNSSDHLRWQQLIKKSYDNFSPFSFSYERFAEDIAMASIDINKVNKHYLQHQYKHLQYKNGSKLFKYLDYETITNTRFDNELLGSIYSQYVHFAFNIPCQTLKLENLRTSENPSLKLLKMILKLNHNSYKIYNNKFSPRSIYMYINTYNEIAQGEPIILSPGYKYLIHISQTRRKLYGVTNRCRNEIFTTKLYDPSLEHVSIYEGNYGDCYKCEVQKLMVKNCNCYFDKLPIMKIENVSPRLCWNMTIFNTSEIWRNEDCIINVLRRSLHDYKSCDKYKFDKCDIIKYKTGIQKEHLIEKSNLINKNGEKVLDNLYKELFPHEKPTKSINEEMKNNVLQLIISRQSEFGELFKEDREYPFPELLSDIGGLMGLWLGMSIIGIFEAMQFIYLYVIQLSTCKDDQKSLEMTIDVVDNEEQLVKDS